MAKIDYKNRQILMSSGYDNDGQKDVDLYYDRFDKVMFYKDLEGNMYLASGSVYDPTPIPNENKIIMAFMDLGSFDGAPYGIVTLEFENVVKPSSINVDNFSINGLKAYGVYLWNESNDKQIVVALPDNIEGYDYDVTAVVENLAGDINTLTSKVGVRMSYKMFESDESFCAYTDGGYDNNNEVLDGNLIWNPGNGLFWSYDGKPFESSGRMLAYWFPYIYYVLSEGDYYEFDNIGEYRTFEVTNGNSPSSDSVVAVCGTPPTINDYDANWNDGSPYALSEDACAYYNGASASPTINLTLKFNTEDNKFYADTLETLAPNGFYLIEDVDWYIIEIEDGVDINDSLASSLCNPAPTFLKGNIISLNSTDPDSYPGSGDTWFDVSGNGNDLVWQDNTPSWNLMGPNDNEGAFSLVATDQGLVPHNASLNISGSDVTIEVWFKLSSDLNYRYIFGKDPSDGDPLQFPGNYDVLIYPDRTALAVLFATAPETFTTKGIGDLANPAFNLNTWYQFVWTQDATGGKVYLNGAEVTEPLVEGTDTSTNLTPNTSDFVVGKRLFGDIGFEGQLGIINIFDYKLTSEEVASNYSALASTFA